MKLARKRNRILLVDDEPDITTAFKVTLEDAGFIVHPYNDPLIALSEFNQAIMISLSLILKCLVWMALRYTTSSKRKTTKPRYVF